MKRPSGFSLIEVTFAIGIFAFVAVAILGLYSVAIESLGKSQYELTAANLVTRIVEDYRSQLANDSPPGFDLPTPAELIAGTAVTGELLVDASGRTVSGTEAIYQISYQLERQPGPDERVQMHLNLRWPAAAANPSVSLEITSMLSRYR